MIHLERLALLTERIRRRREARRILFESLAVRTELRNWTQKQRLANGKPISEPPEPCDL